MTQFSANESALISIITWVIEGFGGKRALGFLLKIELCRKRSKFHMQFCLGALNNVLYVFLRLRDITYAKKPVFVVSSARDRKDGNFTYNPAKILIFCNV